jgi:hypothetical protein
MVMKLTPSRWGKQRSISKEKNAVMTSAHVFGPTVKDPKQTGSTYKWLTVFEEEGRRVLTFKGWWVLGECDMSNQPLPLPLLVHQKYVLPLILHS